MTYLFGRATPGGKKWLGGKTAKKYTCVFPYYHLQFSTVFIKLTSEDPENH